MALFQDEYQKSRILIATGVLDGGMWTAISIWGTLHYTHVEMERVRKDMEKIGKERVQ
jgi:hypothetical protein